MKSLIIVLVSVLIFASSFVSKNAGDGFVVIVNAANTTPDLTASQVKLIYLRKINKRWKEISKNIVPVDKKGDSESRTSFVKDVLNMTSADLSRYYTEKEYQCAEAAPTKLNSDEDIVQFVSNNVGAIGFVSKSAVKGNVKVVFSY